MVLEMGKQKFEFDVENPVGSDKRNPLNRFFMYKNNKSLKLTLEERIYKLERDETAFL